MGKSVEMCSWELSPSLSWPGPLWLSSLRNGFQQAGPFPPTTTLLRPPVARAIQPQAPTDGACHWVGPGSATVRAHSWPWRPGESKSKGRKGLNLALPSIKPAVLNLVLNFSEVVSAEPGLHQPGGWRGRWRGLRHC